jgi:hypothetical protein
MTAATFVPQPRTNLLGAIKPQGCRCRSASQTLLPQCRNYRRPSETRRRCRFVSREARTHQAQPSIPSVLRHWGSLNPHSPGTVPAV